ncbi:MAG: type II secretion system F family protein [Enterocloster asparagiformis]|nr:type II secretion system F family protein [Enterocloster asparagiformis]
MAHYRYKARRMNGTRCTGTLEAADEQSFLELLHRKELYCYEYYRIEAEDGRCTSGKVKYDAIPPFCRQMSTMLGAGVPVSRALSVCGSSTSDRFLRKALARLNETVQKGRTLSEAMAEMNGVFPELLVHMAATGELNGSLDRVMDKMAGHYSREAKLRKKIKSAMTYPIILLTVTLLSTAFMLTTVLPKFADLLSGAELPAFTLFLLRVSALLENHGLHILLALLGIWGLAAWILMIPAVRLEKDRLLLELPVAGRLLKTVYTAQFASAFSVLYASGISILESLDAAAAVMGNSYIRACLAQVGNDLRKGEMLSQSLERRNIFLPVFVSVTAAGEESGALEQILAEAGNDYEEESARALEQMVALLEPCVMIVMALVVGSIVIAVMMPIYTMYSHML